MTTPTSATLDDFGRRLRALEVELGQMRRQALAPTVEQAFAPPTLRPPPPGPQRDPRLVQPRRRLPQFTLPKLRLSSLAGARGLAVAGGVVSLLGIVFFFVLAVNRGWIGPTGRVGLGASAALIVFLGGHELRRRYGETHAALAAVAAGIAGGYATLLAAAALYNLLPDYAALAVAAGIAALGLVSALRWRSEIVAGIGLIGAMLVPLAVITQGRLSPLGTAFAALVYAATVVVGLRFRWRLLLVAGVAASLPQIALLISETRYHGQSPWQILLLDGVFAVLYAATGVAYQLRVGTSRIGPLTTLLTLGAAAFAVISAAWLFDTTTAQGAALLGLAGLYGVAAVFLFAARQTRDLSLLLGVAALTLGAIAMADLLNGQPLAYAWAVEAAGLAWLAHRTREPRLRFAAAAYFALALGHVLFIDAPPTRLFIATAHPLAGAGTVLAVAGAACVIASVERRRESIRAAALWLAAVAATYAASLATLAVAPSFSWGHVALAGLWSVLGLVVLLTGLRTRAPRLRLGGLVWIGTATAIVVAESAAVTQTPRGWCYAIVAAAVLIGALADQLTRNEDLPLEPLTALATLVSAALSWIATFTLLHWATGAVDPEGAAMLGLGAVYGVIAAALLWRTRLRDLSTLFSSLGLLLGASADAVLLQGEARVLGWAVAGVVVAWLARRASEERLRIGATVYLVLALGRTLIVQAPPTHLFRANLHPAAGIVSCLIVTACLAAFARLTPRTGPLGRESRIASWAIAGLLLVYAASTSILALAERVPGGDLHTQFQRGHTAVSAFWGLLGLGLLYAGLKRWPFLRVAGLALLAISLGKIFLFDLSQLSSLARAFSFLAVGAVFLLGGFFYQRLARTSS